MTATLILYETTSVVYGTMSLSLKDKEESEWTYKWKAERKASKAPSSSSPIKPPNFKKMSLKVFHLFMQFFNLEYA